jgi:hypothetical protein
MALNFSDAFSALRCTAVVYAAQVFLLAGCGDAAATARFELRWCSNGELKCVLNQKEGSYVRGGYFSSLDRCNDAIRHLAFYGSKVGGTCVELADWERKKLDSGS